MNRILALVCAVGIVGCSYGERNLGYMVDHPGVLQDSLYTDYHKREESLEARYLNKEISYADYVREKRELENHYKREADKREKILTGTMDESGAGR